MQSITVQQFQESLQTYVEHSIAQHTPLRITCADAQDFIILSANDWEQEQETLAVLQNTPLMQQIDASMQSFTEKTGYRPTEEQLLEILSI